MLDKSQTDMTKPKPPNIVTLSIITTITIVFWIFFSVYRILITNQDINVPPEVLKELDPVLDIETLRSLEEKVHFNENEYGAPYIISNPNTPDSVTPTPIPEIVSVEPATSSASLIEPQ